MTWSYKYPQNLMKLLVSVGLFCAVLFNPLNLVIFSGLRINDMLVLLSFSLAILTCSFSTLLLVFLLLLITALLMPTLLNIEYLSEERLGQFVFFYKYSLPLIVAITFLSIARSKNGVVLIEWGLFIAFAILVIWPYVYFSLLASGVVEGSFRPAFPGPVEFGQTDAHLYSNYLVLSLLYYILWARVALGHTRLFGIIIISTALGAIMLTGSRNGVLILAMSVIIWMIQKLLFSRWRLNGGVDARSLIVFIPAVFGGMALLYLVSEEMYPSELIERTIERILSFSTQDQSFQSRFAKFELALSEWSSSSWLFGAGPVRANLVWYDSGLGALLVHGGIVGLLIVFLGCFILVVRLMSIRGKPREARISILIFVLYFMSNLITEFALVTRSVLPTVLYILIPFAAILARSESMEVKRERNSPLG